MNWRVPAVLLASVALAGCALTPADVMEQGIRQTASSRLVPRDVAACIGKNAERVTRSATTIAYPTGRRDFEVVLQYPDIGSAAVFSVKVSGTGSAITAWIAPFLTPPEVAFGNLIWGC